jgi:pantoate--beta-alanine ligase
MAADLDFPVEIAVVPTVREPDGLAMSSRNAYLEGADRERAVALSRALRAVETSVAAGELNVERALEPGWAELAAAGVEPEYLEARDADRLHRVETFDGAPVLVAVAARVGPARLIDNIVINPKAGSNEVALDPKE